MPPIQEVREEMNAQRAERIRLVAEIKEFAPDVPDDHIDEVLNALWLLEKLDT